MMRPVYLVCALLFAFSFSSFAAGYFEVKLKDQVIFNSTSSVEKRIRLERAALSELDYMYVTYYEGTESPGGDYELRLQSPNKENEVIFANDVSSFVFHMSWVMQRQFTGKLISINFICKEDAKGVARDLNVLVFELELY